MVSPASVSEERICRKKTRSALYENYGQDLYESSSKLCNIDIDKSREVITAKIKTRKTSVYGTSRVPSF